MFPTTDIAQRQPSRRLAKKFNSNSYAIGTTAPNSLTVGDKATQNIAMGKASPSGITSFIFFGAAAADQKFAIHEWNELLHRIDDTKGWIRMAESTALSEKDALHEALVSFKLMPGVSYFIQALSSDVTECLVADGGPHPNNDNTDTSVKVQ